TCGFGATCATTNFPSPYDSVARRRRATGWSATSNYGSATAPREAVTARLARSGRATRAIMPSRKENVMTKSSAARAARLARRRRIEAVLVCEIPNRVDVVFGPGKSPTGVVDCGWIEMNANAKGQDAIGRIFP